MLISEGKHYKMTLISLQKKENAGFSLNSLTIFYDNSIVDGLVIGSTCPPRRIQQEFHCSCYARNETLAVSGWFLLIVSLFSCSQWCCFAGQLTAQNKFRLLGMKHLLPNQYFLLVCSVDSVPSCYIC